MMTQSMYHIVLRTAALTLAFVLLFDSGLVNPVTKQLSSQSQMFIASTIGMYATVESTALNETTAALTAKEQELAQREASLRAREINVDVGGGGASTSDTSTYLLSVLLFLLLFLIIINYILDFVRARAYISSPPYAQDS